MHSKRIGWIEEVLKDIHQVCEMNGLTDTCSELAKALSTFKSEKLGLESAQSHFIVEAKDQRSFRA